MKLHIPPQLYRLLVAIFAGVPATLYAAGMQTPTTITIPDNYTTIVPVDGLDDLLNYAAVEGNIAFKIADVEDGLVFDALSKQLMQSNKSSWYITGSSVDSLSSLSITSSGVRPFYVGGGQNFLMENMGAFNFSGAESTGYGDNKGGTCMIVYGTAAFHNNASLSFTNNSRSYTNRGNGGVFYVNDGDSLSFTQNDYVSFSGNSASANKNSGAGGAIYGMRGAQLNFADNKTLRFVGNKALAITQTGNATVTAYEFAGGAIYLEGAEKTGSISTETSRLTISGNTSVEFLNNEARSEVIDHQAYNCYGGAIRSGDSSEVSISGNGRVTFDSNLAWSESVSNKYTPSAGNVYGGAVYVGSSALFSVTGNGTVLFNQNHACSTGARFTAYARGGAIHGGSGASIVFADNTSLQFTGNTATSLGGNDNSNGSVSGGAIFVADGGSLELLDNDSLVLSGNKVVANGNSANAHGGAISGQNISICGNDSVTITGNIAQSDKYTARGGAIYAISTPNSGVSVGGVLTIAGNGNVLIENNAEIDKSGTRLRAIYTTGKLELSATTGKEIRVRDTIYATGAVTLNADYTPTAGETPVSSGGRSFWMARPQHRC